VFAFATLPVVNVDQAAEEMNGHLGDLTGKFLKLPPTPAVQRLGRAIKSVFPHLQERPPARARLAVLDAVVADAIDSGLRDVRESRSRSINDNAIVTACIEYASAASRAPTIAEMRRAAHVSETRLRLAFVRTYDVPPSVFFRAWALDQARRRLLNPGNRKLTVGETAIDLGFSHLGRFAAYYHTQYGEWPSKTLARSAGLDPNAGPRRTNAKPLAAVSTAT
jgi:AraC-like DNA-binding protein